MKIRHSEPYAPLRARLPAIGDQLDAIMKFASFLHESGQELPGPVLDCRAMSRRKAALPQACSATYRPAGRRGLTTACPAEFQSDSLAGISISEFHDSHTQNHRLYGALGAEFGRLHRLVAGSAAEAVRALRALLPGFERRMLDSGDQGVRYACFIGRRNLAEDDSACPPGRTRSASRRCRPARAAFPGDPGRGHDRGQLHSR